MLKKLADDSGDAGKMPRPYRALEFAPEIGNVDEGQHRARIHVLDAR